MRVNNLYGFPWNQRPATENGRLYFEGGGYPSGANIRGAFTPMEHMAGRTQFESDAVTESMLEKDQVGKYRVIADTNTAVMDEATIDGIERYVKAGGIFITCGDTGRHSPEKPDSWPIDRITGFKVSDQQPGQGALALAPDQKLLPADFTPPDKVNGKRLEPLGPDSQNLLTWSDGATAVGYRDLGKGIIITLGTNFDREHVNNFFAHLFLNLKLDPIPAHFEGTGPEVFWRHFLSNNGLYDVWTLRNNSRTDPAQGDLILDDELRPTWAIDLQSGNRIAITDGKLPVVNLAPWDTIIYITPRATISSAASEWFELQRGWWQGTTDPGTPLPPLDMKLTRDLTYDWAFQPVDPAQTDASALMTTTTDDSSWPKVPMGIFTLPDHPDVKHAVLRKHFHIPDEWNKGRTTLHVPSGSGASHYFLDGEPFDPNANVPLPGGSDHVVAVDIQGPQVLLGTTGGAWLSYHPDPEAKQDISGTWDSSSDLMNWTQKIALPGMWAMEPQTYLRGVIINGRYLSPVRDGSELNINITPWALPGKVNELVLLCNGDKGSLSEVALEFHKPGTYP
jgi:hypothetical protein